MYHIHHLSFIYERSSSFSRKEDSDTLKNDSWGDDKVETITENS